MRFVLSITLLGATIIAAVLPAHADTLHILATGVFENALRDLDARFRQTQHVDIDLAVVNAGEAAKRLSAGLPYDLILTSSASIDQLTAAGRVSPGSKVDIGRMRLGLAVKDGTTPPEIGTDDTFRAALTAAPSVAYIDPNGGGTSGVFFGKLFTRLGIAEEIKGKAVLCPTGTEVNNALRLGHAVLGMTQASELIGADGIHFVGFLPDDLQLVTVYGAAIPTTSAAPDKAKAFVAFLTGQEGSERLRQGGWQPPAQP